MRNRLIAAAAVAAVVLAAACAPGATGAAGACRTSPEPVVAVIDFGNTTATYGTTVTGVEEAATARLITLLKESGCYVVVERSELQRLIAQQGLESTRPEALARAAGAGYVITGVVTRATVATPQVSALGVRVGVTQAQVEVDVRATDIITGTVIVSKTGAGRASNPNLQVSSLPVGGTLAFNDPALGPLLAEAANTAVQDVVTAIRRAF